MAAKMVQEMDQDGVSHTYTPYKRPSLIQRLFARMCSFSISVGSSYGFPPPRE